MANEDIIRERLSEALDDAHHGATEHLGDLGEMVVLGFLSKHWHISPFRGDDVVKMIVDRLIGADKAIKDDFMDTFNPDNIRVCSNCGEWMTEGYYIAGEYACCEDCGVGLYLKDKSLGLSTKEEAKEAFVNALREDEEEDYGEIYYTEW